jgi:hypothetical protein
MKKSTIVFVELGMLLGIIAAGYLLPGATPLRTFLFAGGSCFVLGNILLIRSIRHVGAQANTTTNGSGPWPHILRAFAILAVGWFFYFLFTVDW